MKWLLSFFLMACCYSLQAQTKEMTLLLDRYLISSKEDRVNVHCIGAPAYLHYKLKKGKKWFALSRDGVLTLRSHQPLQERYLIEMKAKRGQWKKESTFVLLKDQFEQNKVVAHRGAWKNTGVPENSLAALTASFDLACAGSEFDVHLSADSVLFVHHDANRGGVFLEKTKAAELRQIKLSNGEALPLLSDFLEKGMEQNKTKLVLELKPSVISAERSLLLAQKAVAAVRKAKAEAWIIYISFDYALLLEILRLDPFAKVAYLKGDVAPEKLAADKMYGLDYNAAVLQSKKDWIAKAKSLGLTTNVWTVNDPVLMDHFLGQGIDFITTNEPEMALQKQTRKN